MGEIEIRVICMQTRSGEHFIHLRIQVSFCVGIECVMGINCLWPFLKRFSRKTNLREFSSQTAAIDASCWLHKALYVSISECGNRERWGEFRHFVFMSRLKVIKAVAVSIWKIKCYSLFNLRFIGIFQAYLRCVKNAGVRPFVVFDGLPLPAKANVNDRRQRWESYIQPTSHA